MKLTWPIYIILAIVGAVSFWAASFLATAAVERLLFGSPGTIALIGALYQLLRDEAQYEKNLSLQRDQQHFVLGVTSHMANIAFDRHVDFCEQYIARMQKGLSDMFITGPTMDAIVIANELSDIRLKYRAWLPAEIQDKVMPFEDGLRKIGGGSHALKHLPQGEKRDHVVEETYDKFDEVLALHSRGKTTEEKIAAGKIMDDLQDILGVKQLVQLRIALVDEAVKTLEKKG